VGHLNPNLPLKSKVTMDSKKTITRGIQQNLAQASQGNEFNY
jgi:hypothetical protein